MVVRYLKYCFIVVRLEHDDFHFLLTAHHAVKEVKAKLPVSRGLGGGKACLFNLRNRNSLKSAALISTCQAALRFLHETK